MPDQSAVEQNLAPIRKHVLDAVKVMFDRVALDQHLADNKDNKETLQDCEFGMILLLVNRWFRTESHESEFFTSINSGDFERVVVDLVRRVVARIIPRKQDQDGGESKEICFFTGEPYTKYEKRGNVTRYSANLDAAMITLAFLAPAAEQFNEQLTKREHELDVAGLPGWVRNLRDAVLFVVSEGLSYAKECRVQHNNKFLGFTSDPESNKAHPETGGLERESDRQLGLDRDHDRLFFAWTACETINDMGAWRKSYLDQRIPIAPPEEAAKELRSLISELNGTLVEAAAWCEERFLPEFQKFKVEDPRELVREVNLKKGAVLGDQLEQSIEDLRGSVQHVYHFSQYAAIRSLVPKLLSLKEVDTIVDRLDRLVTTSIMNSDLDKSQQEDLFKTLTRTYSLGESNPKDYPDDAWYPLVVRSLSGLLSRTLSDFKGRYTRSEIQAETLKFQRSLEGHVSNLIARRPSVENPGDERLWSYAIDQPYVLYATQRTIFALMQYVDFLKEVDRFQTEEPEVDKREEELSLLVARRLAKDLFQPVIRELLAQVTPPAVSATAPPTNTQTEIPLPEETWAAGAIRTTFDRLISVAQDFKDSRVAQTLEARAGNLTLVRETVVGTPSTEDDVQQMPDRKRQYFQAFKEKWDRILQLGQTGEKLSLLHRSNTWESKAVTEILFQDLLAEYLRRSTGSFLELLGDDNPSGLLGLIEQAKVNEESFKKAKGAKAS